MQTLPARQKIEIKKKGVGSESEHDLVSKGKMKRIGNLYQKIISIENLQLADKNARKGKAHQYGVKIFDKDRDNKLLALHEILKNKSYKTSEYKTFMINDPKPREIFCLPYFPDRIVHHAIMNILEPIFVATFTTDTYSCIKGKGIHAAVEAIEKAFLDREQTRYWLKIDLKKFYASINHDILKMQIRKKIKDQDLLDLLDEIIESAPGLPIGNYLSQYLANFNLTYFDHYVKEELAVKKYFRYADDIAIPSGDKKYLHQLLWTITEYLQRELKLTVKENYQVIAISQKQGLDILGYVFYGPYKRVRKKIKQNCFRMLSKNPNIQSLSSYKGWFDHANCINLKRKINGKILGV